MVLDKDQTMSKTTVYDKDIHLLTNDTMHAYR